MFPSPVWKYFTLVQYMKGRADFGLISAVAGQWTMQGQLQYGREVRGEYQYRQVSSER
jgi:hypothetical protein